MTVQIVQKLIEFFLNFIIINVSIFHKNMLYFWFILAIIALLVSTALFWSIKKRPYLFSACVIGLSALILAGYFFFGNSPALENYFVEKQKAADVKKMLKHFKKTDEIIEALKKAIAQKDKSPAEQAKGYYLLGRLYRAEKNTAEAAKVFHRAHEIKPNNFSYAFEYLQSIYILNNQTHTPEIDQLMAQLEKQEPDNPALLDFLGYDAYMHRNNEAAVRYWEKLLPYLSGNPKARKAILLAIGKAQKKLVK